MPRRRRCDPMRRSRDGHASRATPAPWPRGHEAAGASAGPVSGCQDATNEPEIASTYTRVLSKGAGGSTGAPAALARSRWSRVYYARCTRRSATCQRDRMTQATSSPPALGDARAKRRSTIPPTTQSPACMQRQRCGVKPTVSDKSQCRKQVYGVVVPIGSRSIIRLNADIIGCTMAKHGQPTSVLVSTQ